MAEKRQRAFLTDRFVFQSPSMAFSRARLHADRIELSGWLLGGRYLRLIPLERVLQVDAPSDRSLVIWLSTGETLRIRIRRALRWKREIEIHQKSKERNQS
jgi:hypothetical protein